MKGVKGMKEGEGREGGEGGEGGEGLFIKNFLTSKRRSFVN